MSPKVKLTPSEAEALLWAWADAQVPMFNESARESAWYRDRLRPDDFTGHAYAVQAGGDPPEICGEFCIHCGHRKTEVAFLNEGPCDGRTNNHRQESAK